jgi:predicted permease
MTWWDKLLASCRALFRKEEIEADMAEELRSHIDMQTQQNVEAGMPLEEARRAALRDFGWAETIKETCREQRGLGWLHVLARDTRFGWRILCKNRGFTAVSVLSLAAGIAVNVVVFSCLDALLFRSPPGVKEPGRLVYLHEMGGGIPYAEFEFLRDHSSVVSGLAASAQCKSGVRLEYASSTASADALTHGRQVEYPNVRFVSANYFSLIGTQFKLGRNFLSEEDQRPGSHPVVILSHLFWERRFNSDPDLVGRTVTLNQKPYTVVGIAPENCPHEPGVFVPPAVWVPFMMQSELDSGQFGLRPNNGGWGGVRFYARLKPGATMGQAETELSVLDDQFAKEYFDPKERRFPWPKYLESGFTFLPWRPAPMKLIVLLILMVSGSVLLVACANVTSLLLARATVRQREMSVRLTLGASRARLVCQLVAESLILACLSGSLGLATGIWLADAVWPRLVANVLPPGLGDSFNFGLDWRLIRYALLLTVATGVAFGLVPAFEATKTSLASALKQERVFLGHRLSRFHLRGFLIIAQVAVSLTFLIGTTLMLRRVQTGAIREYGFETKHLLMIDFSTPARNTPEFQQALLETIRTTTGVRSASLAQVWYAHYVRYQSMLVDGRTPSRAAGLALSRVTPDYFTTLNISIIRGRNFTMEEAKAEAPVLIVSESFAKQFWPGQEPLRHRLKISETNAEAEIVGVVKDGVREIRSQYELQPYAGDFYSPLSPNTAEKSEVWVRTSGNPYDIMPVLHREVPSLDAAVRFGGRRLSDLAAVWVRPMVFLATAVGILGAFALVLASVGVYGVVAYAAAQRTQEVGIRTALGAQPWRILRLMLWEGMRLVMLGIAVGLFGSAGLSWILRSFFYGLNPMDPITFVGVSLILAIAALLACYLPARRATKVDPMVALRYE